MRSLQKLSMVMGVSSLDSQSICKLSLDKLDCWHSVKTKLTTQNCRLIIEQQVGYHCRSFQPFFKLRYARFHPAIDGVLFYPELMVVDVMTQEFSDGCYGVCHVIPPVFLMVWLRMGAAIAAPDIETLVSNWPGRYWSNQSPAWSQSRVKHCSLLIP